MAATPHSAFFDNLGCLTIQAAPAAARGEEQSPHIRGRNSWLGSSFVWLPIFMVLAPQLTARVAWRGC